MKTSEKPSRGRPRAFDREAALAAAMRLFWVKGYAATSIADLCGAMGIAPPSLYAAFGNKEDLYLAALGLYGERHRDDVWRTFDAADTARGAIEGFLTSSANHLTRPDRPRGCMVTLSSVREEGSERLGRTVAEGRAEGQRLLEQRLQQGIEAGELPHETDIAGLARMFLSVQQGMSIQARDGASADELMAVAHAAMAAWPRHG